MRDCLKMGSNSLTSLKLPFPSTKKKSGALWPGVLPNRLWTRYDHWQEVQSHMHTHDGGIHAKGAPKIISFIDTPMRRHSNPTQNILQNASSCLGAILQVFGNELPTGIGGGPEGLKHVHTRQPCSRPQRAQRSVR